MADLTTLQSDVIIRPPRIVLYGTPKIGKSTFAASAPNPVFADCEDGLDGINTAKVKINTFQELLNMINDLGSQDHKFQTFVIDSATQIEPMIYAHVCQENNVAHIEKIGYGKGYAYAFNHWHNLLNLLTMLRDVKKMTIIFIAHEQVIKFSDPMSDTYNYYSPKISEKYADLIFAWADAMLFAKQKVLSRAIKEETGMNKGATKEIKALDGGRFLYTTEQPSFLAGHRASLALPDELPFSWDSFIGSINKRQQ